MGDDLVRKAVRLQQATRPFWTTLALIGDFVVAPWPRALRSLAAAALLGSLAALVGRPPGFAAALAENAEAQGFWVSGLAVRVALAIALRRTEADTSLALVLPPGSYPAAAWAALRQLDAFALLGWAALARSAWRRGQANLATAVLVCLGLVARRVDLPHPRHPGDRGAACGWPSCPSDRRFDYNRRRSQDRNGVPACVRPFSRLPRRSPMIRAIGNHPGPGRPGGRPGRREPPARPGVGGARLADRPAEAARGGRRGPRAGPIVQTITAPGAVEPVEEAEIASQIVGRVVAVNVKDGDPVKKGDLLVKLDDTDAKARLDSAQARIDRLRAAIDQAEAELEKADRDVDPLRQARRPGRIDPDRAGRRPLAAGQGDGRRSR